MSDKKKKLARALSKKMGMSHQAAMNVLSGRAGSSELNGAETGGIHRPFSSEGMSPPDAQNSTWDARAFLNGKDPQIKQAADAAYLVLAAAGFKRLDDAARRVLAAAGLARNWLYDYGGVYELPPAYTVRFYTELPLMNPVTEAMSNKITVFTVVVGPDRAYAQIMTEPQGGIVWGVGEGPPTIDGAVILATRMIDFVRQKIPGGLPPATLTRRTVRVSVDGEPGALHYDGTCPKCNAPVVGVLPAKMPTQEVECSACHAKLKISAAK